MPTIKCPIHIYIITKKKKTHAWLLTCMSGRVWLSLSQREPKLDTSNSLRVIIDIVNKVKTLHRSIHRDQTEMTYYTILQVLKVAL